jgi:hypothetical protein
MSKLLVASLLFMLVSFTSTTRLSLADGANMADDLEHLNKIWGQAWLENNVALVEKLMADDYLYIAPNGKLLDRKAILNIMKSPSYHLDASTRTPLVVKTAGTDVAVMVFRSQAAGTFEGKSFKDDHNCTMLCVRRGTEWRVLLEQCSPNNQ